ncbi:MAG: hypothetical protein K2F65_05760, partial [Eubacterium sp.]|nr:hypothetical protein [Eubacterium sp.]
MRKPKWFKKSLSVFLAFLMLLSSITVGFTAFAAREDWTQFEDSYSMSMGDQGKITYTLSGQAVKELAYAMDNDVVRGLKYKIKNDGSGGKNSDNPAADCENILEYKDGSVVLQDTDNNDLLNVAEALHRLASEYFKNNQGSKSGSKFHNTMHGFVDHLTWNSSGRLFYDIMHDDMTTDLWHIMCQIFTGDGLAESSNVNKGTRTLTINRTIAACLNEADPSGNRNVQTVPDDLGLTYIYWYYNQTSQVVGTKYYQVTNFGEAPNKVGSNTGSHQPPLCDKGSTDANSNYRRFSTGINDFASALKTFDSKVSKDILKILKEGQAAAKADKASAYSKLTNEQRTIILNQASAAIDALKTAYDKAPTRPGTQITGAAASNVHKQVYDFYYGDYPIDSLKSYVNDYITYLQTAYVDAVNDLDAMIKSKDENSFTLEDVQKMKDLASEAESVYEFYKTELPSLLTTPTVVAAKSTYDADYDRYVEINNITVARLYRESVDKIEYVEPTDYSIYDDCDEPYSIYENLLEAKDLYELFIPANPTTTQINGMTYIPAADRTDTVKSKNTYDTVYDKYSTYIITAFKERADILKGYYTGTSAPITVNKINYFDIPQMKEEIAAVQEVYDNMPDGVKTQTPVPFNMDEVIPKLLAAIADKEENPGWDRYDIKYPYDTEKASVEKVIKRLSNFVTDEEMNEAVLGFKLNGEMLENLVVENANTIINFVLCYVNQEILKALEKETAKLNLGPATYTWNVAKEVKLYPFPNDYTGKDLVKSRAASVSAINSLVNFAKSKGFNDGYSNITNTFYEDVKAALDDGSLVIDWQVTDFDDFIRAFASAVCSAQGILQAVLQNGENSFKIYGLYPITPYGKCHLYGDAILPLLEMLGANNYTFTMQTATRGTKTVSGLPTYDVYEKQSSNGYDFDIDLALATIVKPLWMRVVDILDGDTVGEIIDLLPNIAYIIHYGRLAKGLQVFKAGLGSIVNLEEIVKTTRSDGKLLLQGIYSINTKWVNDLIQELTKDLGFVIPTIDFGTIASLGHNGDILRPSQRRDTKTNEEIKRRLVEGDAADILVYLIYIISDFIELNFDKINDLISGIKIENEVLNNAIWNLIDTALENCKDERLFGKAIFLALNSNEVQTLDWNEIVKAWDVVKKTIINYGKEEDQTGYTKAEVENALKVFNIAANNALGKLLSGENASTLSEYITDSFFSGETANTLFQTLYKLIDNDAFAMFLTMANIVDSGTINGNSKKMHLDAATIAGVFRNAGYTKIADAFQKSVDLSKVTIDGNEYTIDEKGQVTVGTGDNAVTYTIKGPFTKYYEIPNVPTVDEQGKPVYEEDGTTQKTHTEKVVVYDPFESIHGGELKNPEDPKDKTRFEDTWAITAITDVDTKQTKFNDVISTILQPFNDIIKLVLCGSNRTLVAVGAAEIAGQDGYANIIKPLFDILGVDTLNVAEFESNNSGDPVYKLIKMVTSLMNKLSADPLNTILNALPSLAFTVANGGLQLIIENILTPFNGIVDAVETLGDMDVDNGIFNWAITNIVEPLTGTRAGTWASIHNSLILVANSFLVDVKITVNEVDYTIKLADINWAVLPGGGEEGWSTGKG